MKMLLITLSLILIYLGVYAQTAKLDSFQQLINHASSDTAKINLEIKMAAVLGSYNIDSEINTSNNIIKESKRINYKQGEGNGYLKLAQSHCFKGEYGLANESLKNAERIFKTLKDSLLFATLYGTYGMYYGMQSKYDTSIQFLQKAISINVNNKDKSALATNYSNIAIGYKMQSNFSQALYYQQKSLEIAEVLNDGVQQAYTTLNIGLIYQDIEDRQRAIQTLFKAVDLSKKAELRNVELYAYSNLANVYEENKNPAKAYEYAMKAAALGEKMGDKGIQSASLSKAALSLASLKQYKKAEELDEKAIAVADSTSQPYNSYQAYSAMGTIFTQQEKYAAAIPLFEKAFDALKGGDIYGEEVGQSYADLSACYEHTGNFIKALAAYKLAAQIADSVRSKDNIKKATELSMNYEFDKKQQAIKAKQQNENSVTKAKQMALLLGLGLTLLLAIVAFNAYRSKQRVNVILEQQKQEIQSTLTELNSTQTQLIQQEKMASLGELTAGIAHEIQNPLNFVNNFSETNTELLEEAETELKAGNHEEVGVLLENIKNNEEKITHHGKRADAIVKGMLQHSRNSSGKKEPADVNQLAEEYLRLSYHGLRAKDKSFNARIDANFGNNIGKVNIVPQDMGRVLLNLFNNAFYAVNEKKKTADASYEPTVFVSTISLADKIEITVKDNGSGIPQNILNKIFQPFFTTKPTGEGTGLGLSLSYDIVKAHGGELYVESKEGEGSKFTITLPA